MLYLVGSILINLKMLSLALSEVFKCLCPKWLFSNISWCVVMPVHPRVIFISYYILSHFNHLLFNLFLYLVLFKQMRSFMAYLYFHHFSIDFLKYLISSLFVKKYKICIEEWLDTSPKCIRVNIMRNIFANNLGHYCSIDHLGRNT